ncbi:phospholipase A1-like [Ptychodera flava]|uniref:phospholipase A1-like n=1 Tax=Ptychodera flava TaxID=63121 RepID=UPI00396A558E
MEGMALFRILCISSWLCNIHANQPHDTPFRASYETWTIPESSTLPKPWELSDIKPELIAFRKHCKGWFFNLIEPDCQNISMHQIYSDSMTSATFSQLIDFIETDRLVFIVHGFTGDVTSQWMHITKDEILKVNHRTTVILVDWGRGAALCFSDFRNIYSRQVANTQVVGEWLGIVAKAVTLRQSKVEIWGIGHSLGAHVLAKAGRESGAFTRITGLDPAGPYIENDNQYISLRKTDATFVDVIHTDGYHNTLLPDLLGHFGTLIPLGDIDFYPNYGFDQPMSPGGRFSKRWPVESLGHSRAIELFIWSISHPEAFKTNLQLDDIPAYNKPVTNSSTMYCKSLFWPFNLLLPNQAQMGYYADRIFGCKTGLFYLPTTASEPWSSNLSLKVNL